MKPFYMIDLDGTMYHGTKRIESAKVFIDWCLAHQQPFLFLTNNSSRSPKQSAEHMLKMGYSQIEPKHFYTSAMAAADTVAKQTNKRKAYWIGEEGLKEALLQQGFIWDDSAPDFVFVGLDRQASYTDYSRAIRHVLNGAELVGTNNDRILLSEQGANVGNGSVVALFEYCTGRTAMKIGKPHLPIFEGAVAYAQVNVKEVVVVGDNLETDILCGNQAQVKTILVTTGVHQRNDIDRLNIVPTQVVDALTELID